MGGTQEAVSMHETDTLDATSIAMSSDDHRYKPRKIILFALSGVLLVSAMVAIANHESALPPEQTPSTSLAYDGAEAPTTELGGRRRYGNFNSGRRRYSNYNDSRRR